MNNILGLLIWGVLMMAALSMWPQNAAGRKDASQIMNDGGEKRSAWLKCFPRIFAILQ